MSDESLPTVLEFDVDPDDVEAPPALPTGWYQGEVVEVRTKMREKSGKLGIDVKVRVSVDEFPADFDADYFPEGKDIYYRMLHLEKDRSALYRLKRFCTSTGQVFSSGMDVNDWVGANAYWDVRSELDREGMPSNGIMGVNDEPKE